MRSQTNGRGFALGPEESAAILSAGSSRQRRHGGPAIGKTEEKNELIAALPEHYVPGTNAIFLTN